MLPVPFSGAAAGAATTLAIALGAIAAYTDLRQRRVPNLLVGPFAVGAIALAVLSGNLTGGFVLSVSTAFAFAYAAYRIGAWAGGDAKFFTVMAALYAIATGGSGPFAFATLFLNSVLAMLPIAALMFGKRAAGAKVDWKPAAAKALRAGIAGAVLAGVIAFFVKSPPAGSFAAGFAAAFAISFLSLVFPAIAGAALRRTKKVSQLKEGDIPAVTVINASGKPVVWKRPAVGRLVFEALGGRITAFSKPKGVVVADSSRAGGLSGGEIRKLKALGLKELEVRESVAFAPAVALGFVISLWIRWV